MEWKCQGSAKVHFNLHMFSNQVMILELGAEDISVPGSNMEGIHNLILISSLTVLEKSKSLSIDDAISDATSHSRASAPSGSSAFE